jgi:hypothetical protein
MLASSLYNKFRNAANPQKFFRKSFIAASVAGFIGTYSAAGLIVYNIAQDEWRNDKDFHIASLFSWNAVRKYGFKGGAVAVLGWAGDVSLVYSMAGMTYWRSRRLAEGVNGPVPTPETK